jgi:CRP/FNR family transcriptional regulator
MDNRVKDKLKGFFSFQFEEELLNEISNTGELRFLKTGEILMDINHQVSFVPFLLQGVFKVLSEDKHGNEIVMYFLERGDTCASTFINFINTEKSRIRVVAEVDSEVVLVSLSHFDEWMARYKSFRGYVIESYNIRIKEMIEAIDTLAFMRMDERLLKYLRDKAQVLRETSIYTTHQEIAYDLNTSRVVVSRLLKQLENEGKIVLNRNRIEVLDF